MVGLVRNVQTEQLLNGYRVRITNNGDRSEEFVTSLPLPLVQELAKSWGEDAFSRLEDPLRYEGLADMLKRRKVSLQSARVLDVGCRYGTSCFAVSRLGADLVVGIDIDQTSLELGCCIRDHLSGLPYLRGSSEIDFVLVSPDGQLPFAECSFDIVLCNALFEHISPSVRPSLVKSLWSLIRPGGLLIVHETPNRWWPRDGHTTGLWLVPWMPKLLVQLMSILFLKRFTREQVLNWDFMISQGIRGVSYSEIAKHASGSDSTLDKDTDDIKGHFDMSLKKYHSFINWVVNMLYRSVSRILQTLICKPLGLPSTVVTPDLYMALRKSSGISPSGDSLRDLASISLRKV